MRRPSVTRREMLGALALMTTACKRGFDDDVPPTPKKPATTASVASPPVASVSAAPPVHSSAGLRVIEWDFPPDLSIPFDHTWARKCAALVPDPLPKGEEKIPLLIALHGMGETVDPITGIYGWLKAYELDKAYSALHSPPLDDADFHDLVTPEHLAEVNASLEKNPFRGLVIVCPFVPRQISAEVSFDDYARFLADKVIPRARKELPVIPTTAATGIDGVSLGGISALTMGLMRPETFGAIGSLQPAVFDAPQADRIAAEAQRSLKGRPLRVTTSEQDVYKDALVVFDQKLTERKIAHEFAIYPGPHDYIWNKGPGAIEMLLWHDRTLRRT